MLVIINLKGNSADFQPYYPKQGYNVKPNSFFFIVLCVSGTQLQNLLFLKNYRLFTPRLFPHTPRKPAPCLF